MMDGTSHILSGLSGFVLAVGLFVIRSKYVRARQNKVPDKENSSLLLKVDPVSPILPLSTPFSFGDLLTYSPRMTEILKAANIISATNSTVLIEGESGTGKECLARAIHREGSRSKHPFVPVHLSALPETLLESELFGHEQGAYTGATALRKGRFEMADGGTIFLDEIGDLSPIIQVKLLRVIQERCFERVGGDQSIRVNVRIIAATNKSLTHLVQEGRFREDLYYRLNVVYLKLLPLRERREDFPHLISEMIQKHSAQHEKDISGYTEPFIQKLRNLPFYGNIRELENTIERAVIFSREQSLTQEAIDFMANQTPFRSGSEPSPQDLSRFEKNIDYQKIVEAYYQSNGNKAAASRLLQMRESTYRYHLKKAFELKLITPEKEKPIYDN